MTDELRAAAERLRRWKAGDHEVMESRHMLHANWSMLADAYLAEHPADDDEAVTEDWIESVRTCPWCVIEFNDAVMLDWEESTLYLHTEISDGIGVVTRVELPHLKTRGDVRRFCRAFGKDLKDASANATIDRESQK